MKNVAKNMIRTIKMKIFDFVSFSFGNFICLFLIKMIKKYKGTIKETTKNIFQSRVICNKLRITMTTGKIPSPIPILIRFLSRKLSEFLMNLVTVKPNPQVYKKNKIIVMKLML